MEIERPGPGEEYHFGEPTTPRLASSVILLRDSGDGPEVLLVQRTPKAKFMGGAWVFPGGAVDEGETPAGTGVRELEEEAGVTIGDPAALEPFSRWITPREVKIRFDTWFFVAEAPPGAVPKCDGEECVDARWIRPVDALSAFERDELLLVFPTIKHLQELARFDSVADAFATARAREVQPVEPRFRMENGKPKVLLPGDDGYEEALAS